LVDQVIENVARDEVVSTAGEKYKTLKKSLVDSATPSFR